MPLTMKELLNMPIMSEAKIRTASNALPFRPVESVSVIEIPVENFVRKNELVISTAMGCNGDALIFKEFLKDIFESEAAALMIATGGHIKNIPEEILQIAEELNFPIIEIPWEIRFGDIIEVVLTELHSRHLTKLRRYEDLQNKLLNLFLNSSNLSDAAEYIRKELGNPVVIIDNEGVIKGKSKQSEVLVETLTPYLQQAFSFTDIYESPEPFNIPEDTILTYKIQSTSKLYGYVLLKQMPGPTIQTCSTNEKENTIRSITSSIMLWFQREQAIKETEIRLSDDFVWSLAKGEIDSWDNMSFRSKSMGYNLSIPYVCITAFVDNMEKSSKYNKPIKVDHAQWLYNNINSIKEQIAWAGKHLKLMTLVSYRQDRLVIFLEVQDNQPQQNFNRFLDIIENRLKRFLPDVAMSWGIGENHIGIRTFHKSFLDASTALDICYAENGPGHRSTYSRTGIYRVLQMIANNTELQEITQLAISELSNYDKQRGLDLMNTLKIYIKNQGNVSQTARELNLHRQSLLLYRHLIEPSNTILSGIIIGDEPQFILQNVITVGFNASTSLVWMLCTVWIILVAQITGSTEVCGAPPCPPFPVIVSLK